MLKRFFHLIIATSSLTFLFSVNHNIDHLYLPNGLKVIMVDKKDSDKISLGMFYNVGYHDETKESYGSLDIIREYILNYGSENFSKERMNTIFDQSNTKNAWQRTEAKLDYTYILTPDIKKEKIDSVMLYHSSIMPNPAFNSINFDSIKIDV